MYCTDIIDHFYGDIANSYKRYIGGNIERVIDSLSKTHIVEPYKIGNLRDNDAVIWKNKKDKTAHITIYQKHRFYYLSKKGIKVHPVLLSYRGLSSPKYIVRLKGVI